MIKGGPQLTDFLLYPFPERFLQSHASPQQIPQTDFDLRDHLVIIGYGLNGRHVAWTAHQVDIPYLIIEMNPDTVEEELAKGTSIIYGDATSPAVLEKAHIHQARLVMIAIPDATATRHILQTLAAEVPHLHTIVRTHYTSEVQPLYELGADEVIAEDFETSIEIFTRVLHRYFVPQQTIELLSQKIRNEGYQMLRHPTTSQKSLDILKNYNFKEYIINYKVAAGATATQQSVKDLKLRQDYNVTLLGIQRDDTMITNITPDTLIQAEDNVILFGAFPAIHEIREVFQ